jgi:hypothetical protein
MKQHTQLRFLTVTAFMMLLFGGIFVPMTGAQSPDCWQKKVRTDTVVIPIIDFPISFESEYTEYDERCNTINDGRENLHDRAAEAAIFCHEYGVDIYDLDMSGRGTFVFRATYDEIEGISRTPAQNTLIKGNGVFALYRLTTGEMQLNGPPDWEGKPYVFIWNGCERPNN